MTERTEITLEIQDTEFLFTLTPADVTRYFNAVTQNNKVAPSNNLLRSTVKQTTGVPAPAPGQPHDGHEARRRAPRGVRPRR